MDNLQLKIDVDTKIEDTITDWRPYYRLIINEVWSAQSEVIFDQGKFTVVKACVEHHASHPCDCKLVQFVEDVTVEGIESYIAVNRLRITKLVVNALKQGQLKLRNKKRIDDKINELMKAPLQIEEESKQSTEVIVNPLSQNKNKLLKKNGQKLIESKIPPPKATSKIIEVDE